jgi:hypothetical protein
MRQRISLLLTTACLATTAFAKPPDVKFDRFKGITKIDMPLSYAEKSATVGVPQHALSIFGMFYAESKNDGVGLAVVNYTSDWHYLQCHEIDFLLDGKPFAPVAKPISNSNVLQAGLLAEHFFIPLTRQELETLTSAKKVEWKICNDEYVLQEKYVPNLADYLRGYDAEAAKLGH